MTTASSAAEAGSLVYQIYQSKSDANTLILFEGYEDEAALTAHRNSEHFRTLVVGKIVPLLDGREIVITTQLHPAGLARER